ncbi:MAG: hypothetical protein R2932_01585 [Caldilineaceae bacterium]
MATTAGPERPGKSPALLTHYIAECDDALYQHIAAAESAFPL